MDHHVVTPFKKNDLFPRNLVFIYFYLLDVWWSSMDYYF